MMVSSIVRSCYTKCIPGKFVEGTLNKGEGVCIDRCVVVSLLLREVGNPETVFSCVAKYFQANEVVGKRMQVRFAPCFTAGSGGHNECRPTTRHQRHSRRRQRQAEEE